MREWTQEEEEWFALHLAKAPPLSPESRRRIEALLSLPPDGHDTDVEVQLRTSSPGREL